MKAKERTTVSGVSRRIVGGGETMPTIGDVIHELRTERGLSISDLARMTNTERHTLARMERTTTGNIARFIDVLDALGYELEVVPIDGR